MTTNEYQRKAFHLLGLCIPSAYTWLPQDTFFYLFFPIAVTLVLVDLARLRLRWLGGIYLHVAKKLLRDKEYTQPAASSYFLIGSALTIIFFPKQIAIGALLVVSLSDVASASVGRRCGRHRIWNKTLEGSVAFFVSAWLILTLYFGGQPFKHLVPAFAGTLAEVLPSPINDNLTIPLVIGLSYTIFF